jgi:hypothetical protein
MSLDFVAMLRASLPPFIVWAAVVLFVTFVGHQPGVVCVTPMAWLLACWVGMACVARSRSELKSALLAEAALAGGALGLLQGLLFLFVAPYMGEIKPEERQKMLLLSVGMVVVGMVVSALLSTAVGAAQARKRASK